MSILQEVVARFANKTGRSFEQAEKVLLDLHRQALKSSSLKHKGGVDCWRDPRSGHTIQLREGVVVNVVVSKQTRPIKMRGGDEDA